MSKTVEASDELGETVEPDSAALSRTDRFHITSMLSGAADNCVPLTPDTVIAGATIRDIMRYGQTELYLKLKSDDDLETVLVSLLVQAQKAATNCFNQADCNPPNLEAREVNLRYALKTSDVTIRLFQELVNYRAKKAARVMIVDREPRHGGGKVAPKPRRENTNGGGLAGHSKNAKLKGNGPYT